MGEAAAAEVAPVAIRLTVQPGDRPVLLSIEVRQGGRSNKGGSTDCMISQLEKLVAGASDDEDVAATGIDDQVSRGTTFTVSSAFRQMMRTQS